MRMTQDPTATGQSGLHSSSVWLGPTSQLRSWPDPWLAATQGRLCPPRIKAVNQQVLAKIKSHFRTGVEGLGRDRGWVNVRFSPEELQRWCKGRNSKCGESSSLCEGTQQPGSEDSPAHLSHVCGDSGQRRLKYPGGFWGHHGAAFFRLFSDLNGFSALTSRRAPGFRTHIRTCGCKALSSL